MFDHEIVTAQIVAEALTDAELKAALLADPRRTLAQRGALLPADHEVVVLRHSPKRLHLVVPNQPLPEAQRLSALPDEPSFYQLQQWVSTVVQAGGPRADSLVSRPAELLRGNGVPVPEEVQVAVHRNTEATTYIALLDVDRGAEDDGQISEQPVSFAAGFSGYMVGSWGVMIKP